MASKNSVNSIIGPGSVFEGKFYIAGSLRVDGKFEGEIKTDETLLVGPTGKIKTNIHAKNVVVEGAMIGNIHAQNMVQLEATGKVLGDIHAPVINIAPGVVAKGAINVTGNGKKNAKALVEEAYGDAKGSLDKAAEDASAAKK